MTRRSLTLLLVLAAVWGASYLFIKVALEDLSPAMVVFARTALAALVLLPLAIRRGALAGLRAAAPAVAVLALVQIAAPFLLISEGERHISSSLTGVLVASAPIFTALFAPILDARERMHGWALAGVFVGLGGVALLLGVEATGDTAALLGAGAVLLASAFYALGAFYLNRRFPQTDAIGLVAATMAASAVMVAPLAISSAPDATPALVPLAALVALGVAGTAISFVLWHELIRGAGPARASLVSYVVPIFAVAYGVTLLGEHVGPGALAGLALILAGSWLAAGGRMRRTSGAGVIPVGPPIPPSTAPRGDAITIRASRPEDERALMRLAALDSAAVRPRPAVVAEADGELVAALPLDRGRPLADPFRPTGHLVAMLQQHPRGLRGV